MAESIGFKEWEIIYCDQGSDEIKVREVTCLVTEREARRIANSWQACVWTPGRKYSYREHVRASETKALDRIPIDAKMNPA
jgi:hypothetical protein